MIRALSCLTLLATLAPGASPTAAQEAMNAPDLSALRADLLWSLEDAETKLVGLAEAIPADQYGWQPSEEVRTVSQTFMHVAGANYFLPTLFGVAVPEGIDRGLEQVTDKTKVLDTLEQSFAHARRAVEELPDAEFSKEIQFAGQQSTAQRALLLLVTHGHEHLGQAIAYARSIGVVPPWSAGGGEGDGDEEGDEEGSGEQGSEGEGSSAR